MIRHVLLIAAFTAYVADALDVVERNALAVPGADWPAIRARAMDEARTAATQADAHAIVKRALASLKDGHSFFMPPDDAARLKSSDSPPDRAVVEDRIATIALRGFTGVNWQASRRYVQALREDIAVAQAGGACGYVIDLRDNTGGNLWPQLLALQPLLGTEPVGAFVTPLESEAWTLDANEVRAGDGIMMRMTGPLPAPDVSTRPVAVLLAPETASAGEAVAIAFAGRERTRSFGWHTKGATTGNLRVPMSDGAMLLVASSLMVDRDGHAHRPYVRPDEETNAERRGHGKDVTFDAASAWLRTAHGC